MYKKLSLDTSLDWLIALLALIALVAVLQTFIVGKHYIIPTALLSITVILGNLAWYALHKAKWAKLTNFWCGFLLSVHCFFALFWSVKYRAILGDQFELVLMSTTLFLSILTFLYAKSNNLFVK